MLINGKIEVRQFNRGVDGQYREFAELYTDAPLKQNELDELTSQDWEIDSGVSATGMSQLVECIYRFVANSGTLREKQLQEEKTLILGIAAAAFTDELAVEHADIWRLWKVGDKYVNGEIARHEGGLYRLKLGEGEGEGEGEGDGTLKALAHQAPDAPGMNTLWVRIDATGAAGTLTDPIPFVVDMEAQPGRYYSYGGKTYKFIWHAPVLCHVGREPGAAGMAAFWKEVKN